MQMQLIWGKAGYLGIGRKVQETLRNEGRTLLPIWALARESHVDLAAVDETL